MAIETTWYHQNLNALQQLWQKGLYGPIFEKLTLWDGCSPDNLKAPVFDELGTRQTYLLFL